MGYLFPLARFVVTLTILMFYVYVGGLVWVLNSYLFRGYGDITFLIVGFVIIYLLLDRLDNKHSVLNRRNPSKWAMPILLIFIALRVIGYLGLWQTGFWEIMHLIDLGLPAANPNTNIFWAIMKLSEFGFLLPFINRSDLKAPLRLDPKILVW